MDEELPMVNDLDYKQAMRDAAAGGARGAITAGATEAGKEVASP